MIMASVSVLQPPLLNEQHARAHWQQLPDSAFALSLSAYSQQHAGLNIVITTDSRRALLLEDALRFYNGTSKAPMVLHFPDWETLPYDHFSPHQDIISQRLSTLQQLGQLRAGTLIISINTLIQRIAPLHFIQQFSFSIKVSQQLNIDQFRARLEQAGYHHVSEVLHHGEYANRGSILDIYPMGSELPIRIDLFDDEVDSIRQFDPESQCSQHTLNEFELLPAYEFPTDDAARGVFRSQWRETFAGNPKQCPIYQDISQGIIAAGIEYYLPLFFSETASLFDYFPDNAHVFLLGDIDGSCRNTWQEIEHRYEQRRYDLERPLLEPSKLYINFDTVLQRLKQWPRVELDGVNTSHKLAKIDFAVDKLPELAINHKSKHPLAKLQTFIKLHQDKRLLICTESMGRREIVLELLRSINITPHYFPDFDQFLQANAPLGITIAPIFAGFISDSSNLILISETELFGYSLHQQRVRASHKAIQADAIIRNLAELDIGMPVVHYDHGVGRYYGLKKLTINKLEQEFIELHYANDNKLFVPVTNLHLISRYSGSDQAHAPQHSLGSDRWQKVKRKAAEKVRDVAANLLDVYARREARQGFAFNPPNEDYQQFVSHFPFEETPDQANAIDAVIQDLIAAKPMDRLICGDVGFGKTEVAMRAAFLVVQSHKQVIMLVPTTLLAQQHYQSFCDRFAEWPIRVDVLSRFRSAKEQNQIIQDVANHKIDILIGTHKLLNSQINYHDLGLLIIDEEHRFGVRQKEKFKALRAEIDILTLTATPIPRTLNLAMAQLRELSIIATAPAKRLAVKTFVNNYDKALIREAILRELNRGGQVYFLHNKVETILRIQDELTTLMPEARIIVAHGQMPERQLEQVMADFYHGRFNVLLSTTIIETGIDNPNANTIIINRADHFGLAQLHQLRGRVGRSHHQAYAYLLIPGIKLITKDAKKRLDAISALEDLGIGFTLATHDLEIRGAGEILGEEQSGQMHEVGFSLYMELLEKAINAIREGKSVDLAQPLHTGCEIDCGVSALIPDDYMMDVHLRLVFYKRITMCKTEDELRQLQIELIDRFGLLPTPVKNLFAIADLKLLANNVGCKKIECTDKLGRIEFIDQPAINPEKLITLIQQQAFIYKLDTKQRLTFSKTFDELSQKIAFIENTLKYIQ